jgi:hypothetical protein
MSGTEEAPPQKPDSLLEEYQPEMEKRWGGTHREKSCGVSKTVLGLLYLVTFRATKVVPG